MLYKAAYDAEKTGDVFRRPITPFSKTQPIGVSLADHYAAFAAKIEEYKLQIYNVK